MIGKTPQVRTAKTLIDEVEPRRIDDSLRENETHLVVKIICQLGGNALVVVQRFDHIPLDERVESYFHVERSRSIAAQNSSAGIDRTRPESNSSRRRTASASPSDEASSPLFGGNESKSHAANAPRSLSGNSATASLIWLSDITKNYSATFVHARECRDQNELKNATFISHGAS
jgi:hypothetical protein